MFFIGYTTIIRGGFMNSGIRSYINTMNTSTIDYRNKLNKENVVDSSNSINKNIDKKISSSL